MKKILLIIKKTIKTILKPIYRFIIIPITKFVLLINEKYNKKGRKFENLLSRPNTLLIISLIGAIAIFVVIDQRMINFKESSAEVLKNQKVTVLYDEDNYVVEGVPETVDITLIGSKADLYIAKQSPAKSVTIDLWGLKPGIAHKVDISYEQLTGSISYSVNPSVATIILYEKVTDTKTLTIDLLNQDSLDSKLAIEQVTSNVDSVIIKGASYQVAKVASVKALVDINTLAKIEVDKEMTVSSTLKAYDESGNVVDVEISPAKVDVKLKITSPSKEVPIVIVPEGKVIYNMGISSISINDNKNTTVTIYGNQDVLTSINNIQVPVNVEGLAESKTFKIDLEKPNGIKHMSTDSVSVNVQLSDDISNIELDNISIAGYNLASGYGANILDFSSISVKLKGVTTVLENITATDITAYVDLAGLGEGTHEVDVKVKGTDLKVEYTPAILKVKVKIYKK